MKLQKGITGFTKHCILEFSSIKQLLGCIRTPYQLEGLLKAPTASSNYFRQTIRDTQQRTTFDIVINDTFLWMAAVKTDCEQAPLAFIDLPLPFLEQLYWRSDLIALSAQELCEACSKDALEELDPLELKQIAYWKPQRLGDIIFNWYD